MNIYRKIYETFYGPIPKDQDGRTFEVHHIDGDKTNNSILNLVALSIQDHYDVHDIQGDYGACLKMLTRMNVKSKIVSEMSKKAQQKMLDEGTHLFLNPEFREKAKQNNLDRLRKGTHNFQSKNHQKIIFDAQQKMLDEKTHPFLRENIELFECSVCKKHLSKGNFNHWNHGKDCLPKYILISPTKESYELYGIEEVEKFGLSRSTMRKCLKKNVSGKKGKNKGWFIHRYGKQ
jgi:hypothetical protein